MSQQSWKLLKICDGVSGKELPGGLVQAARSEELQQIRDVGLCPKVLQEEMHEERP